MASDDISVTQWRDAETLGGWPEAAGGAVELDAISDAVIWDDQACRVKPGREPGTGPANVTRITSQCSIPEDRALWSATRVTEALRTGILLGR